MSSRLVVWTIGHSNHEFDLFAQLLAAEQIDFLVDVRSFPYSRFAPQFNREALQTAFDGRGVGYLYMGEELGGRPIRDEHYDADGHALYGAMSQEPWFRAAIKRLLEGASTRRLALACSEGYPDDCHRRLLVGRVLADLGVELRHILPDGSIRVERSVESRQRSLFAEEEPWRSTRSVSHRRRLSTSSRG